MSIFDFVTSKEIAAYWEGLEANRPPYLGEELFPDDKKLGLDLSWIKGKAGQPVVLNLSAFDTKAIPRPRKGFDQVKTQMPFFKESAYVDEELRQELNKVLGSGQQSYIDMVIRRIFDDNNALIESARVAREAMRMQLLATGVISMASNGQNYEYDYGLDSSQKPTATTSWSDPDADILEDIKTWQEAIEDATGVKPTRAVCSRKTFNYLRKNKVITNSIFVLSNGVAKVTEDDLKAYIMKETELDIVVYTKKYVSFNGSMVPFIPDDTFILLPSDTLGKTWFGTTPEESDLMTASAADNVTVVDTGVAVTTMRRADPVNVEVKVTQICLPSFEKADQVLIADVIA